MIKTKHFRIDVVRLFECVVIVFSIVVSIMATIQLETIG